MTTLRNNLADYAHQAWSGWMTYVFTKTTVNSDGSITIPKELVDRWFRQMGTKFADLPENEKEGDYNEADEILEILHKDSKYSLLWTLVSRYKLALKMLLSIASKADAQNDNIEKELAIVEKALKMRDDIKTEKEE